jgi:drug/metabolite transporter (DMT)-like permease
MTRGTALITLLLAAFLWGAGNVANKTVLEHIDPMTAVAMRCLIAAVVIAPFALKEFRGRIPAGWFSSVLIISIFFGTAMGLQQFAFQFTSVTNASFLVNTCSILTPFLAWVMMGERPRGRIVVAASITLSGAFLMTGGTFAISQLNLGDMICLASAVFYAGWMVLLGHHMLRHGQAFLTCVAQFAISGVALSVLAFLTEAPTKSAVAAALPQLLMLGVFSTGAAFLLQTRAQRFVSSSTAAVIVSAESIFGALGAYLVLQEHTPMMGLIGAALILGGIVLAATSAVLLRPPQPVAFQSIRRA